jgi:UDP-glucuronate 4-epimerase
MKLLITGTAGFIGFHLTRRMIDNGHTVVGLDCMNDYYDVNLKYARLAELGINRDSVVDGQMAVSQLFPALRFVKMKLEDREKLTKLFESEKFDAVCHLAAQAGVRHSITNPYVYIESNIVGFINILEACRNFSVKHLAYASSSSVYGLNAQMPFSTSHNVDHPISLYAASKKSNELMAHTYSYLYKLPTTGLRFFTVYGPWGRPDMALFIFTKAILEGKPIEVFNNGLMERDFTYIDDIVEGLVRVIDNAPKGNPDWNPILPDPSSSVVPYKIYNIGNSNPVKLLDFIEAIELATGKKSKRNYLPIQPGDVPATWADVTDLFRDLNYQPASSMVHGVNEFIKWYKNYYDKV